MESKPDWESFFSSSERELKINEATASHRMAVGIVACFVGMACGWALYLLLGSIDTLEGGSAVAASVFLGAMTAIAFYHLGSYIVRIWALLLDHATERPPTEQLTTPHIGPSRPDRGSHGSKDRG